MELLRFEPCVVVVALAEADVKILAEGLEPETFLEPGCSDGRHEHAMAMQTAFVGLAEALRLQGRVIDTSTPRPRGAAGATSAGARYRHFARAPGDAMNMTDLTRPLKTCAASPWLTAVLVWLLGAEARALFVAKGHELIAARELSHARTHTHTAQG